VHTSPFGRHSFLHWLSTQRIPPQQSALVAQIPSGTGLHMQWPDTHPYEQHSLLLEHSAPAAPQFAGGRYRFEHALAATRTSEHTAMQPMRFISPPNPERIRGSR
jgi:hypothetical protein